MEIKDIISSGLLELYATGLATEQENAQVLQWMLQYPEIAEELNQIEAGLLEFSQLNASAPDPAVKERIFAAINAQDVAKVVPITSVPIGKTAVIMSVPRIWKTAAAAAIVLLAGSAVLNLVLYKSNNDISSKLQQAQITTASLEASAKNMESDLQVVQSRYSQPVSLNGLPATPETAAKVFWMKNTGEVYVDPSSLPQAPQGKQYELWAIVDGKPVNAGIIITAKKGERYLIQKMKTIGSVQAFAVSLETANPQPAQSPTEVVSMGKI